MPQGGSAGPNMIDLANGQPAPSEDATRRRATATPRRRRCRPRRSVSREDNLLFRRAASRGRVSRRAASRYSFYQRETPLSLRLGAAARSYGAPDTGNLRGPRTRAARADRAGVRLTTHPSGKAACGARLPRAGGEPWLNFIVYSFAKCCPQSMLAVGLSHRGTAPRGCPRGTFGDVLHL